MHNQRYCIVEDISENLWICPIEQKEDVKENIKEIQLYYERGDYDKERPKDLTETLGLYLWEGEDLTFEAPQLGNKYVS